MHLHSSEGLLSVQYIYVYYFQFPWGGKKKKGKQNE